jgi:hypothetical protein
VKLKLLYVMIFVCAGGTSLSLMASETGDTGQSWTLCVLTMIAVVCTAILWVDVLNDRQAQREEAAAIKAAADEARAEVRVMEAAPPPLRRVQMTVKTAMLAPEDDPNWHRYANGSPVAKHKVEWQPGDPCGMCGSTKTVIDRDPTIGARCLSCGACDDDE